MACPRCGKPVAQGAAFCMHCGQSMAMPGQVATAPRQMPQAAPAFPNPVAANRSKTTWMAIATAFALVLAIFFGLRASGLLRFGSQSPKLDAMKAQGSNPGIDSLKAQGQVGDIPILSAQGSSAGAVLEKQAQQIAMPEDIHNWLAHLEKCELKKRALARKQDSELTDM